MMTIEIFKDLIIDGKETIYEISDEGTIINKKRNFQMTPEITKAGYKRVTLSIDGKKKHYSIHRLVALIFKPTTDPSLQVNHINGNKLDNSVDNLEWCTGYENIKHAYEHNLRTRRLSKEDINIICEMMIKGFGNKKISNILGIPLYTIQSIRVGTSYIEFTKNYKLPKLVNMPKKLDESVVHRICSLLEQGESHKTIARLCNCTTNIVHAIYQRRTWKKISSNYVFPPDKRIWKKLKKSIDRLLLAGLKTEEICKRLDISDEMRKHASGAISKRRRVLCNKGLIQMQRNV